MDAAVADPREETALSALVITVSAEPALRAQALSALPRIGGLELGECQACWLSAVLETAEPKAAIAAIEAVPGVVLVEIVFVEIPSA